MCTSPRYKFDQANTEKNKLINNTHKVCVLQ